MSTNQLITLDNLDKAKDLIQQANLSQIKEIIARSDALKIYAQQAKKGLEIQNQVTEIKIRAEKRAGELLKEEISHKGGRKQLQNATVSLKNLDIEKTQSHRWQKMASLPDNEFEDYIKDTKANKEELTSTGIVRLAAQKKNKEVIAKIESQAINEFTGDYDVIVIDPAWPIEKIERDARPNQTGLDYPTMTIDEIKEFKLPAKADCHLFLWTTHKFLPDSFEILKDWKFKYVCCFVWHKNGGFQPFNLPQYNSEFCLYARKGTPKFKSTKDFMTCFNAERGKHSEKPEEFYETLRRVTPGKRVDIFNRRTIEGFDKYGNEA